MALTVFRGGNGTYDSESVPPLLVLNHGRLFIVQGVATVGCAIPAPFLLLDWPSTAKQLTPRQREIALARLRADGMHVSASGDGEKSVSHTKALKNAVMNWRLWLLCIGYMTIIGCYSLSYFNPTLVAGLGYTGSDAQYSKLFIALTARHPCLSPF